MSRVALVLSEARRDFDTCRRIAGRASSVLAIDAKLRRVASLLIGGQP